MAYVCTITPVTVLPDSLWKTGVLNQVTGLHYTVETLLKDTPEITYKGTFVLRILCYIPNMLS